MYNISVFIAIPTSVLSVLGDSSLHADYDNSIAELEIDRGFNVLQYSFLFTMGVWQVGLNKT